MASPSAMRGRHLTVGDVRIHYLEHAGEGPPLVLLPGITSPAILWAFVSERLAAFSHVYTLDNRGRGLSSSGDALDYWLADYAADTAGVIAQLGLERPLILGHSMGGRIALRLANDFPESVGRMILADPPVSGPGRRDYPIPLQWYLDGLDAACRGVESDATGPILKNWTRAQIALRDEWLPTCGVKAIAQSHQSFQEEDIHALMPGVAVETLLLYAELGGTITEEDAAEITGLIPTCRAERIDGVGHMLPWDNLDAFVDAVRRFVG